MKIAKQNETKSMFVQNCMYLPTWLLPELNAVTEEALEQVIHVEYNQDGLPICWYKKNGKEFLINGRYPLKEVTQLCEEVRNVNPGVVFLFGSDFGYLVVELFEILSQDSYLIIYEQDIFLLKAMFLYFDLTPLLKTKRVIFVSGNESILLQMQNFLFYEIMCQKSLTPMNLMSFSARRNFKREYQNTFKQVYDLLSMFVFYQGNDHLDTMIGYCNIVNNVGAIIKNPSLSCLKGKYKEQVAFIIGNGPSLDKNIVELKKIGNRAIIIAVESAIIPLMKQGIHPDIIVVFERTENTYKLHFKDIVYSDNTTLLGLTVMDPRVYSVFSGAKIPIFRSGNMLTDWFNQYIGEESVLNAGGNVSHLAVNIAMYMGIETIVLVGLDYAFGTEHKSHSIDSIYSEKKGEVFEQRIQSQKTILVDGNHGELLETTALWRDFKTGLEAIIAENNNVKFINSTEGGAKIRGTICRDLSESIDLYCQTPIKQRVNEIILNEKQRVNLAERSKKIKEFIKEIERDKEQLDQFVQMTLQVKISCRTLQKSWRSELQQDTMLKYQKQILQLVTKLNGVLNLSIIRFFMEQSVFASNYIIFKLGIVDTPKKMTTLLELVYQMSLNLNVISQSVRIHFENTIEGLQKIVYEIENEEYEE